VAGKSIQEKGMAEAPEKSYESSHSAHANGIVIPYLFGNWVFGTTCSSARL
jgi:hypothetical protein